MNEKRQIDVLPSSAGLWDSVVLDVEVQTWMDNVDMNVAAEERVALWCSDNG